MMPKKTTLVEVVWEDAASGNITPDSSQPSFLLERKSFGKLLYRDKNMIVLVNTEDKYQIEYTAIPKPWIKEQIYYKSL